MELLSVQDPGEKTGSMSYKQLAQEVTIGDFTFHHLPALETPTVRITRHGLKVLPSHVPAGPQTLQMFAQDDLKEFEERHGITLPPGMTFEDITVRGISCRDLEMGTVLRIGEVKLEVTGVAMPPSHTRLAPGFQELDNYLAQNYLGYFYCRVAIPGEMPALPGTEIIVNTPRHRATFRKMTVQRLCKRQWTSRRRWW